MQRAKNRQNNFEKEKTGGFSPPDTKMHSKTTIIKTVRRQTNRMKW